MASSVFMLVECLVELRDMVAGAGGDTESVTAEQYAALLARIRAIDPAANEAGSYWEEEIECFKPTEEKRWWQFWKK